MSQLDPVMMHLLHRYDTIPREALEELAKGIGIAITRATRLAFWGGLACLAVCTVALAILLSRWTAGTIGFRGFVRGVTPFMGGWIGPFAFWASTRNTRHRRIGQVMLEHLRCPHCGYDIRGLPVDEVDGATVCPECGCAWELRTPGVAGEGGGVPCRRPESIGDGSEREHGHD